MKGLKTISFALLSLTMVLSISSCSKKNNKNSSSTESIVDTSSAEASSSEEVIDRNRDIEEDYGNEQYVEVGANEEGSKYNSALSSVGLVTTNCRTVFYVGEKFDYEGLVVKKVIRRRDLETYDVEVIEQETTDFTVNTDDINMNKVGKYPVRVTVRVGVSTQTSTYHIEVKSSLFETTPNLEYVAGIKARYKSDDKSIREYVMGVDNIVEIDSTDINLQLVRNTIGPNLETQQEFIDLDVDDPNLDIDFSKVDYDKVGSYVIRITYNAGTLTIAGKQYDNIVTSFVCVNISNPIKKIEIEESEDTFEYNVEYNAIDYFANSGWKVRATHTNGDEEVIDVNKELFEVKNMQTLYWDRTQKPQLVLKGTSLSITTSIIIVNEGATVRLFNDLKCMDADDEGAYVEGLGYKIVIDDEGVIYGPAPTSGNATYTVGRASKDTYDGLGFETRVTIKGDKQAFSVVVNNASEEKPTTIVVYFATSSDEVRELIFQDPNGEETSYESPATKQTIVKAIYYATTNGTYKFYASASMYIHGVMIVESE